MSNDVFGYQFQQARFTKQRLLKLTAQHNDSMDTEATTATLFVSLSVKLGVACWRFRPTSDTVLSCQAISIAFAQFGSNGFPVLITP
jgi:hypothetical protein